MKKLFNVGHGLSFIDNDNNIIYDAGGSIHKSKYLSLFPEDNKKYDLIISHWHLDHYKYVESLVKMRRINKIYANKYAYRGKRSEKLISFLKSKSEFIWVTSEAICIVKKRYCLYFNNDTIGLKDLNKSSIIAIESNNEWVLTGDQYSGILGDTLLKSNSNEFENFLIPHHGSLYNNDPSDITMKVTHKLWVSMRKGDIRKKIAKLKEYKEAFAIPFEIVTE